MLQTLTEGKDLHLFLATKILKQNYDTLLAFKTTGSFKS